MMKVAHIITLYRSAVCLLQPKLLALDAYNDLELTVITAPPAGDSELPPLGLRHLSIPMVRPIRPLADLRSVRWLYRILRRERFDVVHTHSAKAGMVGTLAAWLARVPLIVHTYHGLPFYEGQRRFPFHFYRWLEQFACRFRHHVLSQNRRDMAGCAKLMGTAHKVSYEGNGVDAVAVRKAAEAYGERGEADFPPGKLRIALVSRLEPVKRVGDLLQACALLVARGVDVSAVVAGCGPLEPALRREVRDRGLADRVRLVGWAPHAPSLMAAGDVVALTSEKEGMPRSLIEAMALGKPVVATDVLGTQELVVDGETGFLTPLGDPAALAERISLLGSDPQLRARFGQAAVQRVAKEFDDVKIAEFLRGFYLEKSRGRIRPGATCSVT
jgi:glycosyltransferase involved in cell wall biosynthesis